MGNGNYEAFQRKVEPRLNELAEKARQSTVIDSAYYDQFDVKRGLRDTNGKGVLIGLTEISDIQAFDVDANGNRVPAEGRLSYRGYSIDDLVAGFVREKRFGFEEITYLLLFGELPTASQLTEFRGILSGFSQLPPHFVRDIIMKAPSTDMMITLARSVLSLYAYDDRADDTSIENVLRQCLQLIAQFASIAVYGYKVIAYYRKTDSLVIHNPDPELGIAQNILRMIRDDGQFTDLEARVLDMALVLHAEHGGGNNSSFATHVLSSSLTDTYSTIAAALGSLKGPRHGGANIKVVRMIEDMKRELPDYSDASVEDYVDKILRKEAFDRTGLIYGFGHAVYSLSDPRAKILEQWAKMLAKEKDCGKDFELYEKLERLAPQVIGERRKIYKGVSANVDFYSGFVYSMLGLPTEIFTPIFAISRIAGWSAHRIEELSNNGKIIRPGYESVCSAKKYVPIEER